MPNVINPQIIRITDFRPGIADTPSSNYPAGQAQRTNTFRCFADISGSLKPLPARSTTYDGVAFGSPTPGSYLINGIYAAGPLIQTGGTSSDRPHELWVGTEYTTATNREHRLQRWLMAQTPLIKQTIKSVTRADASQALNGWGMTFGTTRSNQTDPDTVGIPVIIAAWAPPLEATSGYVLEFPNDTTPTSNTPYIIVADTQSLVLCHQGRVIARRNSIYSHGVDNSAANVYWNTTEDLYYTAVNDVSSAGGGLFGPFQFVPEQPDGYSVMASMSANELFALKQSGGMVLAGDIDDPTILNLPLVAGAGDGGIYTRLGYMYAATETGLWLWTHGDTSQHISQTMLNDFYRITPEYLVAQRYQWECIDNLVFLSNNFIYDTDTQAFWRLEDTSLATYRFMTRRLQWLYGAMSTYTNASLPVIHSWDMTTKATSYSWQSHPLWVTLDRRVRVREVTVRAIGVGTVVITITPQTGSAQSQTFTFNSLTAPSLHRQNLGVTGDNLVVKIVATGTGGNPAPTIEEVALVPREDPHIGSES